MANGKIRFGKQSGGELALVMPDGVSNTEVVFPESGDLATEQYINNTAVKLTGDETIAGVKTFSSDIVGNVTGNASYATSAGSATNASYATTPATSDNSTSIATTAFVKSVVDSSGSGGYTQSLSSNGWTKLPNGLIIQWGICTDGTNTLPITFPSAFFVVNATRKGVRNDDAGNTAIINSKSSFNYQIGEVNGDQAYYIAVGY